MYKYEVRAAFEPKACEKVDTSFYGALRDFCLFIVTNIRESESFGTLKTVFAAAAKLVMEISNTCINKQMNII